MAVAAPPRPPQPDDLEALIEEARRRQRLRRLRIATASILLAGAGVGAYLAITGRGTGTATSSAPAPRAVASQRCPGVDLGTVAFVRDGALATVDFRRCATRVLVPRGVVGPVEFSADGRHIAFSGGYVAADGGPVHRTRGAGTWSPAANLLAVTKGTNGVELLAPNGGRRVLLPDGWGARTFLFSPDGRTLAVSRSLYAGSDTPPPYHEEIWLVDVATGQRRMILKQPEGALAPPLLAGYSPDGRWLVYWEQTQNSASLAADGLPLLVVRTTGGRPVKITSELHIRDFMTWCGDKLVFVLNHGGRLVTSGNGIAVAAPPAWRPETILPSAGALSWNSVACSPTTPAGQPGGLAIAAGPSSSSDMSGPFDDTRRSIWLASPAKGTKPRQLTVPPQGQSDELPMWSADGSWIVFARTKAGGVRARGRLYAFNPADNTLVGPIARLGGTQSYYGAFGWANRLDWHR